MKQPYLLLGEIVKPQGIRGEVKIRHFTDHPDRFLELSYVWLEEANNFHPIKVERARVQKEDVFLKLQGIDTRDQAEAFRNRQIWVDRENARQLQPGQVFIADILGAKAYDTKGTEIGVLTEVFNTGSTDVFAFQIPGGTLMVPFLKDVILKIDPEKDIIELDERRIEEVGLYEDRNSDSLS